MFNDLSSLTRYLSTRRSGKARDLAAPGPDTEQLMNIIALASRTPDHGKLCPWRFVTIDGKSRTAFADLLRKAFMAGNPGARTIQVETAIATAFMAPALVVLLYAPQPSAKIPDWEQQLSAGAAAMNLLHAAHAHGFTGNWITGWAAYNPIVMAALCEGEERIAGFIHIGTPVNPLEERPRPDLNTIVRHWPQ
ncbi:MAG: nitroreductase [Sphingomonadales bacterium]|nr:nitroreductase [Sphingomonadales bacterium]